MYERHYGLQRRPFSPASTGTDVFVGPQTARFLHAANKAMSANDAAIAITGPAGIGKTTLVNRFIEAIDGDRHVVRIPRLQLRHDEIMDFLLDEFDAENVPASTIKKMGLFKRLVAERSKSGVRVIVAIEDAVRIGDDALVELEALTAADGYDGEGAALILMGDDTLKDLLNSTSLTRLKQRVRLYSELSALAANELTAYLKHCFRVAGADFDQVFADGTSQYVHALTGGVPRITNSLVDSVLISGAEQKLTKIDAALIARVAEDEYGLKTDLPIPTIPDPDPATVREPEPEDAIESHDIQHDHQTLPDLESLASEFAAVQPDSSEVDASTDATEADTVIHPIEAKSIDDADDGNDGDNDDCGNDSDQGGQGDKVPTLISSDRPEAPISAESLPEHEEIPTLQVEYEPGIDFGALLQPDAEPEPTPKRRFSFESVNATTNEHGKAQDSDAVQVSLDKAIEEDIATATAALKKHDETIADDVVFEDTVVEFAIRAGTQVEAPSQNTSRVPASVDCIDIAPAPDDEAVARRAQIATRMTRAETLDDVDEQMAESLFCTQMGMLVRKENSDQATQPPTDQVSEKERNRDSEFELTLVEDKPQERNVEVSIEPLTPNTNLPLTASQRLATVRALNAKRRPAPRVAPQSTDLGTAPQPTGGVTTATLSPAPQPRSIEDQISTIIPTTLATLGVDSRPANDDEDDDDGRGKKRKRGFLSRFRRS